MNLATFRQSRRDLTLAEAIEQCGHIADFDIDPAQYPSAHVYAHDTFILSGPGGFWLILERDEYQSTNRGLLEVVLYAWLFDAEPEAVALHTAIWGA